MKTTKKFIIAALMMLVVSVESFAYPYNNVWVWATVYPANSGTVFVYYYQLPETFNYGAISEFKNSASFTASDAFIWAKPAEGYQFAGAVRDLNRNTIYDPDADRQLWIWENHYFTAFYDHTDYEDVSSSSSSEEMAREALEEMTVPTDIVVAVFTKGAVARLAEGQGTRGRVYSSKLDNKAGDQVTFYAYGDSENVDGEGLVRYGFDYWSNAAGENVSTNREFTFTVSGSEVYYANFKVVSKEEYEANERVPEKFKFDYNNPEWNGEFSGIQNVNAQQQTSDSKVFDLQGRRVSQPTKGVFIQNGKKVIFK